MSIFPRLCISQNFRFLFFPFSTLPSNHRRKNTFYIHFFIFSTTYIQIENLFFSSIFFSPYQAKPKCILIEIKYGLLVRDYLLDNCNTRCNMQLIITMTHSFCGLQYNEDIITKIIFASSNIFQIYMWIFSDLSP